MLALLTMVLAPAAPASIPFTAAAPCIVMNAERLPLARRASPLDSASVSLHGNAVKVCYGRPSLRGRAMLGDRIPFGQVWRTGANEPTMLHTSGPMVVAGMDVPAGTYSLYTVPGKDKWEIILNRSVTQWGHESYYTDAVRAQELGRATVPAGSLAAPVETFTIRFEPEQNGASAILLEWEQTQVRIPIAHKM